MAKKKRKKKSKLNKWWKNHWDEVMLIVGLSAGLLITLRGFGVI